MSYPPVTQFETRERRAEALARLAAERRPRKRRAARRALAILSVRRPVAEGCR